ncbi:MAG: hypothetical protein GY786_09020 [Proteobacteria bacterium]|nr:hypothetical protein [Pseudomonadota bacterium]
MNLIDKIESFFNSFFSDPIILMIVLLTVASIMMFYIVVGKLISTIRYSSMKRSMLNGLIEGIEKKALLISSQNFQPGE